MLDNHFFQSCPSFALCHAEASFLSSLKIYTDTCLAFAFIFVFSSSSAVKSISLKGLLKKSSRIYCFHIESVAGNSLISCSNTDWFFLLLLKAIEYHCPLFFSAHLPANLQEPAKSPLLFSALSQFSSTFASSSLTRNKGRADTEFFLQAFILTFKPHVGCLKFMC